MIEGINYREMWDEFEDLAKIIEVNPWSSKYERVLVALKGIEDKVIMAAKGLEDKREDHVYLKDGKLFALGSGRSTDLGWVLSILFAKYTVDMLWLKSECPVREKEQGKGNCIAHRELLYRYCKILKEIAETYNIKSES